MALPTYDQLRLPLLRHIADGRHFSYPELVPHLVRDFRLSEANLPVTNKGGQTQLINRLPWAKKYLLEEGVETLESNPTVIDKTYLQSFPECRLYLQRSKKKQI